MANKILTIVGMGPGVSYSVAKKFANNGFTVAMIARGEERLNEYKAEFKERNLNAEGFRADASDEYSLKEAFEKIRTTIGNTNVLVYNAFSMRQSYPSQLKFEDCITDFRINVAGALVASQLVLPSMLEKKEGTILFTGGKTALEPMSIYSSLGIGKAGIRNLCFSMYEELKPKNIHAATITIMGFVKQGTKWDADLIAEEYWKLHLQKPAEYEKEIQV